MTQKKVIVVIPTHNDQEIIKNSISRVNSYINSLPHLWKIQLFVIENGSTDNTKNICKKLSRKYSNIKFAYLNQKGRGRALRHVFQNYDADIYCYMDSDLSTNVKSLKNLIIMAKSYDLVMGDRYHPKSRTKRNIYRLVLSKTYNTLVNLMFSVNYGDFQCGFKAFNKEIVKNILPQVNDDHWFFDTEIIILSQKKGYNILELPIEWKESENSKVKIFKDTAYHFSRIIEFKERLKSYEKNKKSK